jgi:hypothetical protein
MIMKRNYYFLLLAALVFGLSFSVTSCKSDDDNSNDDEGEVFTDGPQNPDDETATKFWSVAGELVGLDEYTDDYKSKEFEPTIGIEDPNNSQVRIVYTNSAEAAAERFAHLVNLDAEQVTEVTTEKEWKDDAVGTLTYKKITDGTAWATVDVKIKQIPKLEKIIYRSPTQGDENGGVTGGKRAYYRFGDVLSRNNADGKLEYWICVRPAFDPEGKGDSHWISVSPLPKDNLYTWTYKNVNKKKKINVQRTYVLPTGICTSEEHMQNLAEMLFAIIHPDTWYDNVDKYAGDTKKSMKIFHDFHKSKIKYHNSHFWWSVQTLWLYKDIYEKVFGMSFISLWNLIDKDGLYLLYNGKTWKSGSAPTLYQAHYFNTPGGIHANMQTEKPFSKVTKAVYNEKDPSKDIELDVSTCTLEKPYYVNEKFFGDSHPRFIVRYATADQLFKPNRNYDNSKVLSNLTQYYVYYDLVDTGTNKPEVTTEEDEKAITKKYNP